MKKQYSYLLIALLSVCIVACQNWDDRVTVSDNALTKTLYSEISAQSELSKFSELLVKSGYDKLLSASKNYTVWAPTNKALEGFDLASLNDTTALKLFVGNHVALQTYPMPTATQLVRIQMMNNKYVPFSNGRLGESTIVGANKFTANGVLHTLDKPSAVVPNLLGFINASKDTYVQNKVLGSLSYLVLNPAKAIVDSISATTGAPVYRPGTGIEQKNKFTDVVYDLADESKQFTYILLTNEAFAAEVTKLSPYFKTSTADSTYNLASFQVLKDLAVEGLYTVDNLPGVLKSKFGVDVPLDKAALVRTINLSNGVAYVFNKADVTLQNKLQPIVVQGENYNAQLQNVSATAIAIREKFNPITGQNFRDLSIIAHGVTGFWVRYDVPEVPVMKYKVYWVALNDQTRNFRTNAVPIVVNQKLAMGSLTATTFVNTLVPNNTYTEVLLGEYTKTTFGTLNMFLVANGTNSMALDYIKLVPVLP
ncbi:fasciclin domain-containing protein [Fibrella aquatica]|jgi:Fasciclin domain|uniref:fasciclin domain-containing protein n=1 Tax=Fibrella aquatica TaxID=3242487 RepID=UPI0035214237